MKRTSKGEKWLTLQYSPQRRNAIRSKAEKFLKNFEVSLPHPTNYQKKEWLAVGYYLYLEYGLLFHRSLFNE